MKTLAALVLVLIGITYWITMVVSVWWYVVYKEIYPDFAGKPEIVQYAALFALSVVSVFWSSLVVGLTYVLPVARLVAWLEP